MAQKKKKKELAPPREARPLLTTQRTTRGPVDPPRVWPQDLPSLSEGRLAECSTLLPESGRKADQEWLERRRVFLSSPGFRKDLMEYQEKYPRSYWENWKDLCQQASEYDKKLFDLVCNAIEAREKQHGHSLFTVRMPQVGLCSRSDAERLCQKWGLDEGSDWRWIEWLAQNWNPISAAMPPNEPAELKIDPRFESWTATVERAPYPFGWKAREVTLTLRPGVSLRDANHGLQGALGYFEVKTVRGRPRLTVQDEGILRALFTQYHVEIPRQRKRTIDLVYAHAQSGGVVVGRSTVAERYRVWLRGENKGTIKKREKCGPSKL